MPEEKPFSPSADRNKDAIAEVLKRYFSSCNNVFEIGSGTGQHAVYVAEKLPHLTWQPSDLLDKHDGIKKWIKESKCSNVLPPLEFDVMKNSIAKDKYDAIFTANTFHIMPWDVIEKCLWRVGNALEPKGIFVIYGPFNFSGKFTSISNEAFDAKLRHENTLMGIRNYEQVCLEAKKNKLHPLTTIPMPANNFILVFRKKS